MVIDLKFTIAERIALLNIMPTEGSVITLRVVRELQHTLGFSDEELTKWKMKNRVQPDGRTIVTWDSAFAEVTKDVKIGEAARGIITEQLKVMSERQTLRLELLDLYEKFVGGKTVKEVEKA